MYRAYLNSQEVDAIFAGNRAALAGIDILRKICNHPDLIERTKWEGSDLYGKPERSGKLTVAMKVCIVCTAAGLSWAVLHVAVVSLCNLEWLMPLGLMVFNWHFSYNVQNCTCS